MSYVPNDIWEAPPLSPEDERLIEAYRSAGRSADDLPYTKEFDGLFSGLGLTDNLENRHAVIQRLFRLRKTGRLPHVGKYSV